MDIKAGKSYEKQDLSGTELEEATVENCNFTVTNLNESSFAQVDFQNCRFLNTKFIGSSFVEVNFQGCLFIGINFSKISTTLVSFGFKQCKFDNCILADIDIRGTQFQESEFVECDFQRAVLLKCSFEASHFSTVSFRSCDLQKADFTDATGYRIDPTINKVRNAKFSMPAVVGLLEGLEVVIQN